MIDEFRLTDELRWTPEAEAKLKNIPFFVRSQARMQIEAIARATALDTVTPELVDQARSQTGQ
ncbi:MAG: PCP reductase family protein [Thermosynechococcaceae cyanobacterium]